MPTHEILSSVKRRLRHLLKRWDVDDQVQDTIVGFLQGQARGSIKDPEGYLYGIAHHVAMRDMRRSVYRRKRLSDVTLDQLAYSIADPNGDLEAAAIKDEQRRILHRRIDSLPERRQQVVRMHLRGASVAEIRSALSLNETQERLLKSRALKELRRAA
jgi:RNA polymerase sigma factor (sigma-70 family)